MGVDGQRRSLTQLRRGALEYCVLALVAHEERYAVDLVRDLGEIQALVTSEGTLYPLLGKMRRDGVLEHEWEESESGPPRKYYRVTAAGDERLTALRGYWQELTETLTKLGAK